MLLAICCGGLRASARGKSGITLLDMSERPRLSPAVAATRRAVRDCWDEAELSPGSLVLVALSGGADSLALAAAAAFEAGKQGMRVGAVVIDHGMQAGSAEVAESAAGVARSLGLDPVLVRRVVVGQDGGPEAAARAARYGALVQAAVELGAAAIMTGHTLDDQAETVLLGLARGSGPTSLQGMPAIAALDAVGRPADKGLPLLRPLLGLRRAQTEAACEAQGLTPWQDPMNTDPAYTRVRVRSTVLPLLERELGPGVAEALARTAELLREDAAALDQQVEELLGELVQPAEGGLAIPVAALAANPAALRNRIIRAVARLEFGVALNREHTLAAARLVTHWHGQHGVDVPGIRVVRQGAMLFFTTAPKGHTLAVIEHDH